MPINFVTGLPRSGKTLWTLTQIKGIAQQDKRQVYYCNIPEVSIPGWLEIKHPDEWLSLPDGAIIVVDELQDFWPKQPTGAKVPLPILELSKHGKRGFDFYFITQEPELVHTTPRGLCQFHYYVIRAFGANACVIYKFQRMQTHPDKVKSKGEKFPWAYNKEAFNWYKSADVHNIKRQLPKKLLAIPLVLLLAGLAIWAAVWFMGRTTDLAKNSGKAPSSAAAGAQGSGVGQSAAGKVVQTPAEYLASYRPRVEGLMHTAPVYDGLTAPKVVPVPAACMESKSGGCKCFTQQATPYATTLQVCRQIVRNGLFLAFVQPADPPPPREAKQASTASAELPPSVLIDSPGKTAGEATTVAAVAPVNQPRVQPGSKWSFQSGAQ